jgi:hypothetical protein
MNKNKAAGTKWESQIVAHLTVNGFPHVERRALSGANDRGDIAGIPGVVIEAKSARALDLSGWLDEAHTERANDRARIGVVWFKRRGRASAGDGYVLMDGHTFTELLKESGWGR